MEKLLNELKKISGVLDNETSKECELVNELHEKKALIKTLTKEYIDKIKFYNIAEEYGRQPGENVDERYYYKDKNGNAVKGIFILKDVIEEYKDDFLAIVYYLTKEGKILQFKETNAYNNWYEFKKRTLLNEDYILGDTLEFKEYDNISFATIEDVISAIKNNLENRIEKTVRRNTYLSESLESLKKIESVLQDE